MPNGEKENLTGGNGCHKEKAIWKKRSFHLFLFL